MELSLIIKNIENKQAYLGNDSGVMIASWSLDCLPTGSKIGDRINFLINEPAADKRSAKEILNEMLRVEDAPSQ